MPEASQAIGRRDDNFGHLILYYQLEQSLQVLARRFEARANIREDKGRFARSLAVGPSLQPGKLGGRTDLAEPYLSRIIAPTLFIVGENDSQAVDRNRKALESLTVDKRLETIGGMTNLFEKSETLREVARLACGWFERCIPESG